MESFLEIIGVTLPPLGSVFTTALVVHVLAGLVGVVSGALAALAPKRPGPHPIAGVVYGGSLAIVVASATVLAAVRGPEDAHLVVLGAIAGGAATAGYLARRRRRPGWLRRHIVGMGVSYITLLTAFYVDNGPRLPLWHYLPTVAFWVGPSLIGLPLILRALRRRGGRPAT